MEVVLHDLARKICLVYLDDIVVLGHTWEEHLVNVTRVLDRIQSAGLKLKPQKCQFARVEVVYLGHVVSAEGVRTDPAKIEAVQHFPAPSGVKPFLGLASYYHPNFARVVHALTKKGVPFVWTQAYRVSSGTEDSADILTSSRLSGFQKPFVLETDASIVGPGAVLSQRQDDGQLPTPAGLYSNPNGTKG